MDQSEAWGAYKSQLNKAHHIGWPCSILMLTMANLLSEKSFGIVEPKDGECDVERLDSLTKIVTKFEEHLSQRSAHSLGLPLNQKCKHFVGLSGLLQFNIDNIGDPFTADSIYGLNTMKFETGVLDWFANLWGIEKDEYWGYVTTGGTEANLHGILLGRELLPNGVLYTSRESHYSLFKIARMYRMDLEIISTLPNGEMDCVHLRAKLLTNKDRPAIINVVVGTTFKGALDDLDVVIETLEDCGFSQSQFYIHCDAAVFGFMIPFVNQVPKYTFKKPIGSMSVSGHKFLGTPMPCGVQITRKSYMNLLSQSIDYIDTIDNTITGSRNGHLPMFLWYALNIKGLKGLQKDVEECLRNARYLRDRLKDAGISTLLNETSNVVVFERPHDNEFVHHWQLQCQREMAHVVIMAHVSIEMLDKFLEDFVRKRRIWYQCGKSQPPCLAEDIGIDNCACSIHAIG